MRRPARYLACLMAASVVFVGCTRQHAITADAEAGAEAEAAQGIKASDIAFTAEQYPHYFNAAVAVLRDHGFRIARDDYRFGTITTFPKESPTAAEFWIDDPTTPAQHRSDTLNAQQRTVKIRFEKSGTDSVYVFAVEVLVERLQLPARYLTHSATGQLSADYAAVPQHLSSRGIDGPYAQVLTRDPWLEARLADAVASAVEALSAPDALPPAE